MTNVIGIMFEHEHGDKEFMPIKLSQKDEDTILGIVSKYEVTNPMFDGSIQGNLEVVDLDECSIRKE